MDKRPVLVAALAGLGGAAVVAYTVIKKPPTARMVAFQQAIPTESRIELFSDSGPITGPIATAPPAIPTSSLPRKVPLTKSPLITATVTAGSDVNVYHVDIPRSYAGIITDIGNTMYTPVDANGNQQFYFDFTIDGDLVERVKRIIANPNSPLMLPQPYLATDNINWRCHNGTQQDLVAEVYCNGFMRLRTDS